MTTSAPSPSATGPILVASHERSGTHLLMDLLRRQFPECRGRAGRFVNPHDSLYYSIDRLNANHHRPGSPAECDRVLRAIKRPCLKTHNTPGMERTAPQHRAYINALLAQSTWCYCYRDGRSVLCSLQRFRQGFDTTASESISAFIREDFGDGRSRARAWADHVRAWLATPNVVPIRFEDTVKKTREQIQQIAAALSMNPDFLEPLLPKPTKSRLEHWFSRLTGRDESTNISGRGNGLEPVKWNNAFTRQDRQFFHEQAGDMLIELGYETSDAWIGASESAARSAS
ncbi:MAG: sulfotransferase domain-containing protein [Phycisphaeraceae bacterium]|nr:sulfotransferase domain-containing protein [Phycisphaeraceae bacterium]MCW5762146.1 sulfotransferase domain-containing protein [Phycisphaeraceae bacterium]